MIPKRKLKKERKHMRTSKIHRLISAGLGVLACVVVAQTSEARKIQGFEAGDPAFTSKGDAGNQGTYQADAPQEGSVQFLITTINTGANEDGATPQSGTSAVAFSTLNSFFFNTTIANQTGSGLLIPFTFLAGDTTLTFQYDFLSNEPNNVPARADFAFEALFDPGTSSLLGSVTHFATASASSPSLLFGAQTPFIFHTGYQTFTISLTGLGLVAGNTYDLGLGVVDATNSDHASGLLVDNVQVVGVPEPSTVGLGIAGAVLMVALRSRIKRKS